MAIVTVLPGREYRAQRELRAGHSAVEMQVKKSLRALRNKNQIDILVCAINSIYIIWLFSAKAHACDIHAPYRDLLSELI